MWDVRSWIWEVRSEMWSSVKLSGVSVGVLPAINISKNFSNPGSAVYRTRLRLLFCKGYFKASGLRGSC